MENQTCFDLNAALENWRMELAAQPSLSAENRRELETHLRDTFAEMKVRGLSEEESFRLASKKLGQLPHIGKEFQKNKVLIKRRRAFGFGFMSEPQRVEPPLWDIADRSMPSRPAWQASVREQSSRRAR